MLNVDRTAKEYLRHKNLLTMTEKQVKVYRDALVEALQAEGTPDENGHIWLPGKDTMTKYERRASTVFDYEKAKEYLEAHNAWDEGTEEVPAHRALTEDSFTAYIFESAPEGVRVTDFYSAKETWAVKVTEEEQYDY